MPLDAQIVALRIQCRGNAIDNGQGFGIHDCGTRLKESSFSQGDGQSSRVFGEPDVVLRDFLF